MPNGLPCSVEVYRFTLVLALGGLGLRAWGKDTGAEFGGQNFRVRCWTTQEGLPQGRVACLKQTRDGYLWVGTWAGLARFNGREFTVFTRFNTPELTSDAINALAEDTDGTLWIGTHEGLVSYRDHHFARAGPWRKVDSLSISHLAASRAGGVWVHAGFGVAKLQAEGVSRVWQLESDQQPQVRALVEGTDGWLNVFTEGTWLAVSPDASSIRTNCQVLGGARLVRAGWPGPATGEAWLGRLDGLRLVGAGGEEAVATNQLKGETVGVLYQDRQQRLWVGTATGVVYGDAANGWSSHDLGLGAAVCFEQDHEGNMWVGAELGLAQLRPVGARAYTKRDGLPSDDVLSVCEATDGALWVGTSHGLARLGHSHLETFPAERELLPFRDASVWPGDRGGVWVSKPGWSLDEVQGGGWLTRLHAYCLAGSVNALYCDLQGRLWLGTERGAFAFHPNDFGRPCLVFTNAAAQDVRSILEARDGTLWFGTMKQGLARLRNGVLTIFTQRDGLSDNSVWSLLEDQEGTLWIGTDHGFSRYRHGRLFAFSSRHGLPENTVNCVLEDEAGDLWLSGLHGIHRARRQDLNAVADGKAAAAQFFTVGVADGMENPETNGGENQPAGWKARDGRLWFPTVLGVVVIDPKVFPAEAAAPPARLDQVMVDGQEILGDGSKASDPRSEAHKPGFAFRAAHTELRIPPGRGRVVEFRYTANTLVEPELVRFKYRLVGLDADWREETSEAAVRYTDLRPGCYRFEVIAADSHHVWNPHPAGFGFAVTPFFWQTGTFYLLAVMFLVGTAAALHAYRLRWQHRLLKLEEQRAVAAERARIARDLHDDLGASMTGIALQLEAAQQRGGARQDQLAALAGETRSLAHELRELAWATNPRCDNAGSLAAFLGEYTERFCKAAGLACRFDFPRDGEACNVPARVRHELLLVVKESLANTAKHAGARTVTVSLSLDQTEARLTVRDDGRGCEASHRNGGSGLPNLRERLEQAGGMFDFQSQPGRGTLVSATLPLARQAEQPVG